MKNPERMSPRERWKEVPHFPGCAVSAMGRLRRDGVILAPSRDKHGALVRTLRHKDGYLTNARIARLVGEAFNRTFRPDLRAVYRNGDKSDCRPCNLRWVKIRDVTGIPYSRNPKP